MANITFFYDNDWKKYIPTYSTQHPNFLAIQTQHRDFNKPWRSMYGAGSGWGRFVIENGITDRIDFEETDGVNLVASLTPGNYNATQICAHMKAQMEAAPGAGSTYTWEYLESGGDKNKFKVTSNGAGGGGIFKLNCTSGPNSARSPDAMLGFEGDKAGFLTYTADYIRIHSSEALRMDFGANRDIYGVGIRKHNFQSSASVKIHGSLDNFATCPLNEAFTIQADILVKYWNIVKQYQYWRIYIQDIDNPAGFVEMGFVFLGGRFQPTRNFVRGPVTPVDQSVIKESDSGQITSIQKPRYETRAYTFMGTNQFAEFDAMFEAVGTSRELFVVEDPDSFLTTVKYIQFTNWDWNPIPGGVFWNLSISYRELV